MESSRSSSRASDSCSADEVEPAVLETMRMLLGLLANSGEVRIFSSLAR